MVIQYKTICDAVARDDVEHVRDEIKRNPEVVAHWKPLCDAAFHGRVDCITALLDAGADPNQKAGTASRHTPLTRIAQYHKTIPRHRRHVESMDLLLSRGAKPGISAGPMDLVPSAYASVGPEVAFIDVLERWGGNDTVFVAAALNDLERLRAHLSKASPIDLLDHCHRTPLHFVCLSGMWRLSGSDDSIACANELLNSGVPIDSVQAIPDGGEVFEANALWYAIAHSHNVDLVEFLLKHGSDPQSSAFAATYSGNTEIVELLQEYGIDWNVTFSGYTPLLELLNYRKTKLVPWLLANGASATVQNPQGRNALHIAALRGLRKDYLKMLLDYGADPTSTDAEGKTPLDLARSNKKHATVEFLRSL